MGAPLKRAGARRVTDEHLRELEELADTAGAIVVGEMSQQLERPHAGTYLGSGKIDELRDLVAGTSATLVIFDDELSPSQGKNIEDTDEAGDKDTSDLLTEVSRGLDKQLWFLEAHTQEPSGKFRN